MSPFIFMACECGKSIHVYIPKEKFFKAKIDVSSWQREYSEKVKAEKFEEAKKLAERLKAEFVDARDSDNIICVNCGKVHPFSELKQET